MSHRNDDINHLFAHLGLNPGDYQEVNQPAAAPAEPAAAAPIPAAVVPEPTVITLPPPVQAPPPVPERQPAAVAAPPAARSWPLLNAVTQAPPKVARIESAKRPPIVAVSAAQPEAPQLPPAAAVAETALTGAFRRLIAPEPVAAPSGHLRLRYGEQQPGRRVAEEKEQTLEEVFARITDPQRPRQS